MKNKKILITGVCGFIGKNLAKKLMNENRVIGVDNFEYSNRDEMRKYSEQKFGKNNVEQFLKTINDAF